MRKLVVLSLALVFAVKAFSQEDPQAKKNLPLPSRAGDHFMVQLAFNSWQGTPDSIDSHMGGFQRSGNIYLMLDKPFKGNPRMSVAAGIGIGTNNIYFKKMMVDIASPTPVLPFRAVDSTDNYKKYKLTTTFLEVPLELRFTKNPLTPNKSFKAAIGLKLGTLLKAQTKGKNLRNSGGTLFSEKTIKEAAKGYFNTTRVSATARVGYGNFTLFGAYALTGMFKDGVAPDIKTLQVGLTFSGL